VRTEPRKGDDLVTRQAGFSLHAEIAGKSHQRKKLERLCRYITRPAIAERRLSLANNGNAIIALKTPYDDGTTHVVLNPMAFMGRLKRVFKIDPNAARSRSVTNVAAQSGSSPRERILMSSRRH
jgi:hypothetical protein